MSLKDRLRVDPITRSESDALCAEHHYSGKPYSKSMVHLGVFWDGQLEGVMAFGAPIDRRKVLHLVEGTEWHEMAELNRMAFSPALPRNSESRALAVAFRLFKKYAPHVKWLLSYADGAQSGSGTIYRATGWLLTQVRPNGSIYRLPDGRIVTDIGVRTSAALQAELSAIAGHSVRTLADLDEVGAELLDGMQYRYIKPLQKGLKLTCQVIPYEALATGEMVQGPTLDGDARSTRQLVLM